MVGVFSINEIGGSDLLFIPELLLPVSILGITAGLRIDQPLPYAAPARLVISHLLQTVPFAGKLTRMTKVQTPAAQETDEELAAAIARRIQGAAELEKAKQAFSWLYARHSRLLRAFLSSRISRSELDDCEQAIWEKVWFRLPDQFQGNFRAWLHQISRNHLVDWWRKSRPDELSETFDVSDRNVQTPDELLIDQEQKETLERCLNKLSDHMSAVVRGRLRGESYEVLCEQLAIDSARAQKLLFSAKQLLQTCVEGGGK